MDEEANGIWSEKGTRSQHKKQACTLTKRYAHTR
jgi:hypothetical protein